MMMTCFVVVVSVVDDDDDESSSQACGEEQLARGQPTEICLLVAAHKVR